MIVPSHQWQPDLGRGTHTCQDCGYAVSDMVLTTRPELVPVCAPGQTPTFPNAWNVEGHVFVHPTVGSLTLVCAECKTAFPLVDIGAAKIPFCSRFSWAYSPPKTAAPLAAVGYSPPPIWRSLWDGLDKDTQPEQESKPKKKYAICPDCDKEISPVLDAYYGKDQFMAARCQPCRAKRGERRSA